jgi:hypothetical protein
MLTIAHAAWATRMPWLACPARTTSRPWQSPYVSLRTLKGKIRADRPAARPPASLSAASRRPGHIRLRAAHRPRPAAASASQRA